MQAVHLSVCHLSKSENHETINFFFIWNGTNRYALFLQFRLHPIVFFNLFPYSASSLSPLNWWILLFPIHLLRRIKFPSLWVVVFCSTALPSFGHDLQHHCRAPTRCVLFLMGRGLTPSPSNCWISFLIVIACTIGPPGYILWRLQSDALDPMIIIGESRKKPTGRAMDFKFS